ncbi:hypothetical protein Asp14428_00470 [Actinoplanes sp. NBRC 14428]|uniref:Uncharacterized protein n=1 Tax=Pseudosporangium ferrugineum TaxID=439699 RepID=A0A2T0SJ36_9ACTN|nr:DUF5990 family protein [Pseudosporangium ferrugineum]PRY33429.1 hypothetical protein CLV70_101591 [Pseudosporangium ferrugineum]BCJ48572.1 hypothetical protein Asp14428_00470 [Actinoplanes sp. NBRC 14428]
MHIRIEGHDLPGRRGGPGADALRRDNVQVGVQRKNEVIDRFPADAEEVAWEFEITSREVDELLDVGGPYVHGRPGARFLYLSWGAVHGTLFHGFRRAKLMFGDVPTAVLRTVHDDGGLLVGRLGLTDERGGPRCARVRPPDIVWQAR